MGSQAPISEIDKNIYGVLKLHGMTEAQIKTIIETSIMKLVILAVSPKLPGVAKHLEAARKACKATRLN